MKSLTWVQRLIHKGTKFVMHDCDSYHAYEAIAEPNPIQNGHAEIVGYKIPVNDSSVIVFRPDCAGGSNSVLNLDLLDVNGAIVKDCSAYWNKFYRKK